MKTIAVSIDEDLLAAVDRVARHRRPSRRGGTAARRSNRSEVIREAVREFLWHRQRRERESKDRDVLAAHRVRLARQLEALVGEQAKP